MNFAFLVSKRNCIIYGFSLYELKGEMIFAMLWFSVNLELTYEKSNRNIHRLGFGLKHENVFSKLLEECQEVLDVKNPDSIPNDERKRLRVEKETKDFDSDHYLSDLYEPDDVLSEMIRDKQTIFEISQIEKLSDEDSAKLADYTRKDVKIETQNKFGTMCGLLDILFAYCYDIRVNFGKDCECFSRF